MNKKTDGKYFTLVLHSHIPYVLSHGSWPHGMDWLYEAAAECYLPLLLAFERLAEEGLPPRVVMSFTPVLADQLKDPGFRSGFEEYLGMKAEIAADDIKYFRKTGDPLLGLAEFWRDWYKSLKQTFRERCRGDILESFRRLQEAGQLEVMTSAATHGYFPLLGSDVSIAHQIRQGRHTHRRFFGREAAGFWVPECGYRPRYRWTSPFGGQAAERHGVDELLKAGGAGYFFVDTHLLKGGEVKGVYMERFPGLKLLWEKYKKEYHPESADGKDPYLPYLAEPSLEPFFARDDMSGTQVWSRQGGYPGDGDYLEFHKKHFPGGLRYWKITSSSGDLALKEPYQPAAAREKVRVHARHFASLLEGILAGGDRRVIAALYDTELFGHWWFEGPEWIYHVMRELAAGPVAARTASECLELCRPETIVSLPEGSWGQGGFHWIWFNTDTAWIWEKIYRVEDEAAGLLEDSGAWDRRLLRQFFREKFLLESSDWPFLISTWTARDYAENRAAEHYERAARLAGWLRRRAPLTPAEQVLLETYESEDRVFEEVVLPDGTVI